MKKIIVSACLCVCSIITNAQSIGSFLDFYLGQSMSEVRSIINSKYYSSEWNGNVCKIFNVSLAGEQFNQLTIEFSGGQIISATFLNSPDHIITFSSSDFNQRMESQINIQQQRIARLYAQYKSKYGKETASSDTSVIWTDLSGKSINLFVTINNNHSYDSYMGNVNVIVKYSTRQGNF